MKRVIAASTIVVAVFLVTAFSAGPGIASPGIPAGLASAIHAKLGAGALRFGVPSGRRGIPAVGYLSHWASTTAMAAITATAMTTARRAALVEVRFFTTTSRADYAPHRSNPPSASSTPRVRSRHDLRPEEVP